MYLKFLIMFRIGSIEICIYKCFLNLGSLVGQGDTGAFVGRNEKL